MQKLFEMLARLWTCSVADARKKLGIPSDADEAKEIERLSGILFDPVRSEYISISPVERVPPFMCTALGLAADADEKSLRAKLLALTAPDETRAKLCSALGLSLDAKGDVILGKVAELQAAVADRRAEQLVDGAIKDGRITPAAREFWCSAARTNYDAAAQAVAGLPKILSDPAKPPPALRATAAAALSDTELRLCSMLGVSQEDYAKQKAADAAALN